MNNKRFSVLLLVVLFSTFAFAQNASLTRVEPPNWWAGMKNPNLQIMVYGQNIGKLRPAISYPGVTLKRTHLVENANYMFIDLVLDPTVTAGSFDINFKLAGNTVITHKYELKPRRKGAAQVVGFQPSDALYLITPDRFVNGDQSNDNVAEMTEKLDRTNIGGRHGGDIKGIINRLDYIKDLGFTAIWLNPVLENNMETYSYHGYSTTDFYRVDPRFGTNELYRQMVELASQKGIKVIMDMIVNHCGSEHWWMNDLPTTDWLNQWPSYTQTNHRKSVLQDPYVAPSDKKIFTDGWFVPTMPDLNQRNFLMANYLTQNSIWWVEYSGISGIRMDTYPYPDMDYMTEWTRRVMEEYPTFQIVGEEWTTNPAIVAYWQKGKQNPNGYTSELTSLMDFPLQDALAKALTEEEGWSTGWRRLYEMAANDFLYANPANLVTFPDNHDMSRFYTQVGFDRSLLELGLAYVSTFRGIPQIYYGTEVLMANPADNDDHGIIRSDFPGGWVEDRVSAFSGLGLSKEQRETQGFVKKLLNWRKQNEVIHKGKLVHYFPEDGVYVYFRVLGAKKVMVLLNRNETNTSIDTERFREVLGLASVGKEVMSGTTINLKESITVPAKKAWIIEIN